MNCFDVQSLRRRESLDHTTLLSAAYDGLPGVLRLHPGVRELLLRRRLAARRVHAGGPVAARRVQAPLRRGQVLEGCFRRHDLPGKASCVGGLLGDEAGAQALLQVLVALLLAREDVEGLVRVERRSFFGRSFADFADFLMERFRIPGVALGMSKKLRCD